MNRRKRRRHTSINGHRYRLAGTLLIGSGAFASLLAQTAVDLPVAPTGFSRASAIYAAPRVSPERGFSIAAMLAGTYDSNVTQGSDSTNGKSAQSDYIVSPAVNLAYVTEGDHLYFGTLANATYDQYGNQSDYSGLNYDVSGFAAYRGGKIIASLVSEVTRDRGTNRLYGDFVEQTMLNNRLTARYRISPKTALLVTVSQQSTVVDTAGFNDTSSFNAGIAGLWSVTPLIDFGPGFRYGIRAGDNQSDRTTVGPNLNLNYQLTTKVALRSTAGLDFVDQGFGSSDAEANWALNLNYQASEIWGLNLSLFRDTQSNATADGGLDEITNYRIGYKRKIRRATLNVGVGYEIRTQASVEGNTSNNQGYDFLTLDSSLSMPVFGDSADLTFSLGYRNLESDDSDRSWDGVQTGLGLLWKF
jgi:hypothetical protein